MQSFKENEIGPNRGEKENDEVKKKKKDSLFSFFNERKKHDSQKD